MFYEIKNLCKCPVQIMVKSKTKPRAFTVKNIPGVGKGKNIYYCEEHRYTDDIEKKRKEKLISVTEVDSISKN
jgi:hypothetical protein